MKSRWNDSIDTPLTSTGVRSKYYTLVVEYLSGKCAFPTDKPDLLEALKEFDEVRREEFSNASGDKLFALPDILKAELVKTYYRK